MADFYKVLAGTDPVVSKVGTLTEGLGFPLREVEPATSGGTVTVRTEIVLDTASYDDQNPVGLGVAYQIIFGAPTSTADWSIDAAGVATCLDTDDYRIRLKIALGRTGGGGVSQLYFRALVNGVPTGNTTHTILDNQRIEIPEVIDGVLAFNAGDTLAFEMIRDTDGNNSGGLTSGVPDVAGWQSSPSAYLQITRTYAVET